MVLIRARPKREYPSVCLYLTHPLSQSQSGDHTLLFSWPGACAGWWLDRLWGDSQGRSLDLNCGQLEALGQIWVFERKPEATVKERSGEAGRGTGRPNWWERGSCCKDADRTMWNGDGGRLPGFCHGDYQADGETVCWCVTCMLPKASVSLPPCSPCAPPRPPAHPVLIFDHLFVSVVAA